MSDIQDVGQQISKLITDSESVSAELRKLAQTIQKSADNIQGMLRSTAQHDYQIMINSFALAKDKITVAVDSLTEALNDSEKWMEKNVGGKSSSLTAELDYLDSEKTAFLKLSTDEVNERWKSTVKYVDETIDNYREALHSRGVPDCNWLNSLLAQHRNAMLEQEAYLLDVASGHGQDTINRMNAYSYPTVYEEFYNDLADQFRSFCAETTNPNYCENIVDKWSINCQRCVPTYELLRRGMDITAMPCENGYDYLGYHPFSVWKNPQIITCTGNDKSEIENAMKNWGNGARAQITVSWSETDGHTFVAEQINGVTHYIDPQSGNEAYDEWIFSAIPGKTQFCRIDNLDFLEYIHDCYRKVS